MRMILAFIFLTFTSGALAQDSLSFYSASNASKRVNANASTTFLCGCSYDDAAKINPDTCGYTPARKVTVEGYTNHKAMRYELDHVLAAKSLGEGLSCWGPERDKLDECYEADGDLISGRSCCNRVNPTFKNAHNDLVNLAPIIGEINNDKSDKPAGEIREGGRAYGMCDVEITSTMWEPPTYRKGEVARIILYMDKKYGDALNMNLGSDNLKRYHIWDESYPVTREEVRRNDKICEEQGFSNPLVSDCR